MGQLFGTDCVRCGPDLCGSSIANFRSDLCDPADGIDDQPVLPADRLHPRPSGSVPTCRMVELGQCAVLLPCDFFKRSCIDRSGSRIVVGQSLSGSIVGCDLGTSPLAVYRVRDSFTYILRDAQPKASSFAVRLWRTSDSWDRSRQT